MLDLIKDKVRKVMFKSVIDGKSVKNGLVEIGK